MKRSLIYLLFCLLACVNLYAQEGARVFTQQALSDEVFLRMKGKSWREGCPVPRSELRYLQVLHVDAEGGTHVGELVCHKDIADDLLDIFRELYQAKYPIERMVLIDEYGADDEASMQDNNTSAFNYRRVAGTRVLSKHARGLAIDVNPRYNPYVRNRGGKRLVSPDNGVKYADRSQDFPYKITPDDLCVRLFKAHGFSWGGNWKNSKDYQHFEKR